MKSKFSKIMGIGFALVLVASMMLFAIPTAAGPYDDLEPTLPNMWAGFTPTPGLLGAWFSDPAITQVGPLAQAINGDLYAYVAGIALATPLNQGTNDIFKSTNDGRTWSVSGVPGYYSLNATTGGGAVVDMVCSSMSEDVIYLTDGNYVYKSINGAVTFALVAAADLEKQLVGACGTQITGEPITCIDVGYDGAGKPIVLIGTKYVTGHLDPDGNPAVGSVYWIADETFSAMWTNLQLGCYPCCEWSDDPSLADGCYDVYAVAAAPGFANVSKVYATITAPLTTINFPINSTAVIEIRAGDAGAIIFTTDADGLITDGDVVFSGGAIGDFPYTMTGNEVVTFTGQGAVIDVAEAVDITVTDGTISWRLVSGAATFCGGTHTVSTLGTVCAWTHVSEVKWNCMWAFEIQHASRIAFPSYYATTPTLFVGVAAVDDQSGDPATLNGPGEGGDVYRVADPVAPSDCIDLNIQGFTTGCAGFYHANICSLDIENDALVAGAWDSYQLQSPTRVYYSADGGWTWAPSKKDPTGTDRTYALFGSSIVAGTRGCDCAFSLSCGANLGEFFNQISLISMSIDAVLDMTHAPGYVSDNPTMYVLTHNENVCNEDCYDIDGVAALHDINSLLRWDGTYWERVHSSRGYAVTATGALLMCTPLYDWVEVSPDFNSTDCLYMANTQFYLTRSLDAGCSWAPLTYPCYDRPTISAWIVVDEDSVLAAGCGTGTYSGFVYRTTNHGAQPWDAFMVLNTIGGMASCGVDFDLSLPRAADSDVLLGDADGQVFISQDLGTTWAEIQDAVTGSFDKDAVTEHQTYVVFDPGYGTAGDPGETMIYAAGGNDIGRCALDLAGALPFKQNWVYICPAAATCDTCALYKASGIDASGDTCLYVSDAGAPAGGSATKTVSGTIAVRYQCDVTTPGAYTDLCTCDVTITTDTLTVLDGFFTDGEPVSIWDYDLFCTATGSLEGDIVVLGLINGGLGSVDIAEVLACDVCGPVTSAFEVISSSLTATISSTETSAYPTGVWRTLNPMALMPPVFPFALVEWEFLQAGALGPNSLIHPEAGLLATPLGIYPDDLWLTAGSNVLWALDDIEVASPTEYIWMWDDPLAAPVIQMSPADGALLATTTTATLEWEPLDAGTSYEVQVYVECPECLSPLEMKAFTTETTSATCITITGLTPGMKYFWKVRVECNSPQVSKWSDLRSFNAALGSVTVLCSPICGADDIILTTNFSWDAVLYATGYELQIVAASADGTADFTGATTYPSDVNALASIPGLEYSTVYYWQVRSVKDGVYSAWAVCLFTTMDEPAEPVEPTPPVVIEETEITPMWIWVIIGIGGALTIAVIILIVTTRRVP